MSPLGRIGCPEGGSHMNSIKRWLVRHEKASSAIGTGALVLAIISFIYSPQVVGTAAAERDSRWNTEEFGSM